MGDFIHLTFGCPEMLNTTDFLGLFFHAFVTTGDGHQCRSILNDNFQLPRNFPQRKNVKINMELIFQIVVEISRVAKIRDWQIFGRYSL